MTPFRRLVAAAVVSAAAFTVTPMTAAAAPASEATYVVQSGDFLLRIAREHGVSLRALLDANDLTAQSVILPGQRLQIPAGGSTPAPAATPTTTSASPAPSSSGGGTTASGTTHTVVAGDALSLIARRYGVSLSALLRANSLSVTSLILPGQRLQIPAGGSTPAPTATPTTTATPAPAGAATNSRVDRVVSYAQAQIGKPYKFFTRGPATFDCSGLTLAAYAQVGVSLIHFSAAQAQQGREVDLSRESIKPGDLVFLSRRDSLGINHVGIATSSTTWIHATGPGDTVRAGRIPAESSITTVRRYIES